MTDRHDADPVQEALDAWNTILDADLTVIRDALECVLDIDQSNDIPAADREPVRNALEKINHLLATVWRP